MEKISALIDKLQELKNSNAGLQSISYYVQLLQAEIAHTRNRQKQEGYRESSHIAVIMPSTALTESVNGYPNNYNYTEKIAPKAVAVAKIPDLEPEPARESQAFVQPEQKPVYQPVAAQVPPEHQAYQPKAFVEPPPEYKAPVAEPVKAPEPQPVAKAPEPPTPEPIPEPVAIQRPMPIPPPPPAPIPEIPEEKRPAMITLYSQNERQETSNNGLHKELKELNQRVAQSTTSLNERFRQGQTELADRLGEMPVKDLRHAIGINDKFQFIQELFRGDIDTYERSIKTINEFSSLQEAEYWIERELKIRQGWEDDNKIVKQFYAIVRKRFT
jgi:hypothetical protein